MMKYSDLMKIVNPSELACVGIDRLATTHRTEGFYGTLNAFNKAFNLEVLKGLEVIALGTTLHYDPHEGEMITVLDITLKG